MNMCRKNRSQKIFESFTECLLHIKHKLLNQNEPISYPVYKPKGMMNPIKVDGPKYLDSHLSNMQVTDFKTRGGQTNISNNQCGRDKNIRNTLPFKYQSGESVVNNRTITTTNYNHKMDSAQYLSPFSIPTPTPTPTTNISVNHNLNDQNMFLQTGNNINERVIIPKQNNQYKNDQNLTKMCQILFEQFMSNNTNTNHINNVGCNYNESTLTNLSNVQLNNTNFNYTSETGTGIRTNLHVNNLSDHELNGINTNYASYPMIPNQQINWNGFENMNHNHNRQTYNVNNIQSNNHPLSSQYVNADANSESLLRTNSLNVNPRTNNITNKALTVRYQILSFGPGTTPIIVNSSIVE